MEKDYILCRWIKWTHYRYYVEMPAAKPVQSYRVSFYYWKGVIKAERYVFIYRPFLFLFVQVFFEFPFWVQCKVITLLYCCSLFQSPWKCFNKSYSDISIFIVYCSCLLRFHFVLNIFLKKKIRTMFGILPTVQK